MSTTYPNIGFDPAPGDPGDVQTLQRQLASAAEWLGNAHTLVQRLANAQSSAWQGDAATAFRDHLNDHLPKYLGDAHESLQQAAGHLSAWNGSLIGYQAHARKLDAELAQARAQLQGATTVEVEAQHNPDLSLAGQTFSSQAELADAQRRLDAATAAVTDAVRQVDAAEQEVQRLIAEAHELEATHQSEAKQIADSLRADSAHLAPEEPGLLSRMLSAIGNGLKACGEFLYAHIGTIGAVAGFLSLLPTPLAPLFMVIAAAASAVSLYKDLSDPKVLGALEHPGFNMATLSAVAAVGGDVLGVIPGVGAVARSSASTINGIKAAAEAGRAMSGAEAAGFAGKTLVKVVGRMGRAGADASTVDRVFGGVGAGAAVYGDLASNNVVSGGDTGSGAAAAVSTATGIKGGIEGVRGSEGVWGHLGRLATAVAR